MWSGRAPSGSVMLWRRHKSGGHPQTKTRSGLWEHGFKVDIRDPDVKEVPSLGWTHDFAFSTCDYVAAVCLCLHPVFNYHEAKERAKVFIARGRPAAMPHPNQHINSLRHSCRRIYFMMYFEWFYCGCNVTHRLHTVTCTQSERFCEEGGGINVICYIHSVRILYHGCLFDHRTSWVSLLSCESKLLPVLTLNYYNLPPAPLGSRLKPLLNLKAARVNCHCCWGGGYSFKANFMFI